MAVPSTGPRPGSLPSRPTLLLPPLQQQLHPAIDTVYDCTACTIHGLASELKGHLSISHLRNHQRITVRQENGEMRYTCSISPQMHRHKGSAEAACNRPSSRQPPPQGQDTQPGAPMGFDAASTIFRCYHTNPCSGEECDFTGLALAVRTHIRESVALQELPVSRGVCGRVAHTTQKPPFQAASTA